MNAQHEGWIPAPDFTEVNESLAKIANQLRGAKMYGAAEIEEIKARAWDEGYTTGNAHNGRRDANPYRRAMKEELSTAAQLDMLPNGSIIRDAYGDQWRKIDNKYWEWLVDEDAHSRLSHEVPLPATLAT